jgi:hypothetical protein
VESHHRQPIRGCNTDEAPKEAGKAMHSRWLIPLALLLGGPVAAFSQPNGIAPAAHRPNCVGCLVSASSSVAGAAPSVDPYQPRAGDIVLYDDFNKLHHFLFKLANTAGPTHVAMVIERADGTPALLELTGPKVATAKVCILDVETRLQAYPGLVMVRRLREPLTAEQSRELTHFAEMQAGKSFALGRVMLLGTPFSARNGLRRDLFGHTYLNRNRWFCSEMVIAAGATAQVIDGKTCCGNATYPRDLAYDETLNLSARYHPPVRWQPSAPR